jgi:hypothetical protein
LALADWIACHGLAFVVVAAAVVDDDDDDDDDDDVIIELDTVGGLDVVDSISNDAVVGRLSAVEE